jgi:hypothetical protein
MSHDFLKGISDPLTVPAPLDVDGLAEQDFAPGDLVAVVSNEAVKVTDFTWDTDIATTRAAFAAAFLGVCTSRVRKGFDDINNDKILQANTKGEYVVDVASGNYNIGDLLAPKKAAGNALTATLEVTATAAHGIFKVIEKVVGGTRVRAIINKSFTK